MTPTDNTTNAEWTKQKWPGNQLITLECTAKYFNGIPVFIYNEDGRYHYTVSDGSASELTHTGICGNCTNYESAQHFVDLLFWRGKLLKSIPNDKRM